MTNYNLILTDQQAEIVKEALELYFRVAFGQLEEVRHHIGHGVWNYPEFCNKIEAAKEMLGRIRIQGYIPKQYKIAWDIMQVIRHRISWDRNPEGGLFVNFDVPMNTSGVPLATIERIE